MRFACVQNCMDATQAFPNSFTSAMCKDYHNFRCTWSFSLSSNGYVQNTGIQKNIAKKVVRKFSNWNREKSSEIFSTGPKKLLIK